MKTMLTWWNGEHPQPDYNPNKPPCMHPTCEERPHGTGFIRTCRLCGFVMAVMGTRPQE